LQAVSLLLADHLQRPDSTEAALSRGLIDEGLLSHHNPPERRLSPLGRHAWSLLARACRKVIERLGEDDHLLLSSPAS
jgi:hypothetical protein